jgi:antitoxin component YwqK of YwqJK toxin-antitoxin module
MDKKLRLETVETLTKCSAFATYKRFYKNGFTRQTIEMKDSKFFGFYREFYKNGKIKYEAEYGDSAKIINDTYFTWDKKGQKYKHSYVVTVKDKRQGKMIYHSAFGRRKKIKVKNAT